MNREVLMEVIADQHRVIRGAHIVPREIELEPQANYVLTGLRRAGKTTLLHRMARQLADEGVPWERIIYVNFEDERLADFTAEDFNAILRLQSELSAEPGHFFFDEIQVVDGWEKFARRIADAKEHVCITGSNARMLSSEIATTLGARYIPVEVAPYGFREYLTAEGMAFDPLALADTKAQGRLAAAFDEYRLHGGLPQVREFRDKRMYLEGVYRNVLLGDVAARNGIRNSRALRLLIKKLAETVQAEVSFTRLHGALKGADAPISKATLIDYVSHAIDAYLVYPLTNAVARFSEREGVQRYYFTDNGILGLFLRSDDSALLENAIAGGLKRRYGDALFFLKSPKTRVDVDFVVPCEGLAVQVAERVDGPAFDREVSALLRLARLDASYSRFVVATRGEARTVEEDGVRIEIVPAERFLLDV